MNDKKNYTWTVCFFEFGNYLRSKSFIVSTLVTLLLLAVSMNLPSLATLFQRFGGGAKRIYLVNETELALQQKEIAAAIPEYQLTFNSYPDRESMLNTVRDADVAGIFVVRGLNDFEWITARREFAKNPETDISDVLQRQVRDEKLKAGGFSESERKSFLAEAHLVVTEEAEASGKSLQQTQLYTYILIMVLYMAILNYGQLTAVSVASEKSTRAMELLITSTKPRYLINGKVFGTGLAGLFQMLAIGLTYYLFLGLNRRALMENSFFASSLRMPVSTFLMAIMVFVLSYLTFAFLFGALGSLVNRSEEVNQVIAPVSLLYVLVIFAGIFATFQPDKLWIAICSYIPLLGPLLFFVRFSMLSLAPWEIALALSIHTATVMLASQAAVVVYRSGVLRYGQAPRILDALRLFSRRGKKADKSSVYDAL